MAQVKITLIRSVAGTLPNQRKTVKALGLKRINSYVVKEDNPVFRGMINVIHHLVKVEEV